MTRLDQPTTITARHLMIALSEVFPDSTHGAIPVIDQYDALEAYLAYDDGALAEIPNALQGYISCLQRGATD